MTRNGKVGRGYARIMNPATDRPVFAFRAPGPQTDRILVPTAFCRECGQDYLAREAVRSS
jgi:hypothetical protein